MRLTAWAHGNVQGVGFRWWTRARALELGLAGYAANRADGRVEVVAEGRPEQVRLLLELLGEMPSTAGRPGRVEVLVPHWGEARGESGFFRR